MGDQRAGRGLAFCGARHGKAAVIDLIERLVP